jgi:hypothetical protein
MDLVDELRNLISTPHGSGEKMARIDMSPEAVEERLVLVAYLFSLQRRSYEEGMSPAAVEQRLRRFAELRRLCLGLAAGTRAT